MPNFGDELKKRRKELSLQQSELARASGVSQSEISMLENGQRNPTLHSVRALETALKVEPGYFRQQEQPEAVDSGLDDFLRSDIPKAFALTAEDIARLRSLKIVKPGESADFQTWTDLARSIVRLRQSREGAA